MNLPLWKSRFREYLELQQASPRSIEGYLYELRQFFDFLETQGIRQLAEVTRDTVEAYRLHLVCAEHRGRHLTVGRQANRLSAVKTFFRFLTEEQFLLVDPASGVKLPRAPRALPKTLLTEREAVLLLESPDTTTPFGLRNRAIFEVLYGTGIRNSELRALAIDDVDLERMEVRVQRGKGSKSRVVPLGEEAAAWVEQYLLHGRVHFQKAGARKATLFLSNRGTAMIRWTLCMLVTDAGKKAGIKKHVTPHALRHAFATHMLRHGAGIRHLQEMLGHESPATTQRYTKLEVSDLRRALVRHHPRERKKSE